MYYWSNSALRGQFDSGEMIADFNSFGNEIVKRDPKLGARWSRYLAEKSTILGKYINAAFQAYTNKEWLSSIFYFLIIAETGLETGNFNLAFVCEENPNKIATTLIEQECVYYFYNQSLQHDLNNPNGYALNKMGDYYYKKGLVDSNQANQEISGYTRKAMEFYILGYFHNEPQA